MVGGGCRVFVGNGGLVGCEGGIGYSDKKKKTIDMLCMWQRSPSLYPEI